MTSRAKPIALRTLEVLLFACALGLLLPPLNWRPQLGVPFSQILLAATCFALSQCLAATQNTKVWWVAILNSISFAVFGWELCRAIVKLT
jgi:hypothetical protein